MKKTITLALTLITLGANAQQKLIATNTVYYDNMGAIQYIDSNEFVYNTWDGSLFSNEPVFEFDGAVYDYSMNDPRIKWNVQNNYSGTSLPLSLSDSWTNTIVAGNATVSQSTSDKTEYTYNVAGQETNMKNYYWDGFSFVLNYEIVTEYTLAGKVSVRENIYHGGGAPEIQQIDSMFYNVSNLLTRSISYWWNGSTLYPGSQSFISYTGTEIQNIQLWQGDDVTPLEWIYDIDYVYTGGKPTNIDAYEVTAGVPSTTVFVEINYTYGANNKIASYEGILAGDVFSQYAYEYNPQGFITLLTTSEMDFNTSLMYVANIKKYYYQSTADVNEIVVAEATIFPNPASDVITIKTNDNIEQVSIYNMNGNLMLTQNSGEISISNFPAGVYIAKVKTSTSVAQARFVKQ